MVLVDTDWGFLVWSVAELNIAIVCACLPLIRPLATMVFPTWFKGSTGVTGSSTSGQNMSAAMKMGSMQREAKRKHPSAVMSKGYGSSEEALATPGIPVSEREMTRERERNGGV